MALPKELQEKEQELKRQKAALAQKEQAQMQLEKRIKANQAQNAETERANQFKAQELIKRENKIADDLNILENEKQALNELKKQLQAKQQRRSVIVIPILFAACIMAGYFAFEQMEVQQQQYKQLNTATRNIDKLTQVLNTTQDSMLDTRTELTTKQKELERTKNMLSELKNTSQQLETEITQLRSNSPTTQAEKDALSLSASTLLTQLSELKLQLEDKYLNDDINEAYIEYQERDLKELERVAQQREFDLHHQLEELQALSEAYTQKEQDLESVNAQLAALTRRYERNQEKLRESQRDYLTSKMQMETLEESNQDLKNQVNKLKVHNKSTP